ncbi:MAG TPA: hypothetical protein VGK74_09835 [Symbiobacteriaceae bacterium]|jgi:hypothetical protein
MPGTIWVVSIYDREAPESGTGHLSFDVGDIVRALGSSARSLSWLVDLWDWQGPTGRNRLLNEVLSTDQLLALYPVGQPVRTVDGDFRAAPDNLAEEELESMAEFPESKACLEIKAWDDSFSVVTKEYAHVEALRARFKQVRDEDPAGFC